MNKYGNLKALWLCGMLKPAEIFPCIFVTVSAHLGRGLKGYADGRPFGLSEKPAAVVIGQIYAPFPCSLPFRHPGNGR